MTDRETWLQVRFQNILLATDLHQNSSLALQYAADLARHFTSKLAALHVFEFGTYSQAVEALDHLPSRERKDAAKLLETFIQKSGFPNVVAQVAVDETFVTTAILKALAKDAADLLVIGTEGIHEGIDHLLLGSNTEALMLGSRCLTLTVGPHVRRNAERKITFQKVLYVSDLTIASTAAATYAFALAQTFGVESVVYQLASRTARKDSVGLTRSAALYCDVLRFADPDLPSDWFDSEFQLSRIVPEAELIAAISEPSNLIVLGVQPASFLQRHLHTSLAYKLVANAFSPVLTVPAEAAGTLRGLGGQS